MAQAVLKPRRAQPFFARHPWVFAGAIERIEGEPADGDEIDLVSSTGNWIARGLYNGIGKIRVRLYSWTPGRSLDADFFRERIVDAVRLRRELNLLGPDRGCRLIFSEADGLSGCIVDQYGDYLTVQFTSLAVAMRKEMLVGLLNEVVRPRGIYLRTEKGIGALEGLTLQDEHLAGDRPPADLTIVENGLKYRVNIAEGQKTGFYHDQRENRRAVAELARDRRVLDAFCYTGGFGLNCAAAGARAVEGIDVSESALALAAENARLNGFDNMSFTKADVFARLNELVATGEQYGVVVLDPPKFARSRSSLPDAIRGYRKLLKSGMKLVESGGYLVMCCCTGLVTPEMLTDLFSQMSADGRAIQILDRRGAAPDHPVSAACLESAYLKCFITRIA